MPSTEPIGSLNPRPRGEENVVDCDLFDKPSTYWKVWNRLLSGLVFDALEAKESGEHAEPSDIDQLLKTTSDAAWEPTEPIGEGGEYRAELGHGEQASAITFEDSLVHGSVLVGWGVRLNFPTALNADLI